MNKLVVFEGIDGSGKSTQIELLLAKLSKNKIDNSVYREPGGNLLSEKIREILLDKSIKITDETETFLFLAARAQLTRDNILPDLTNNKLVICDRFSDSTYVYQGYGKKVDKKVIERCNNFATKNLKPLLTIIIDIDYETSQQRINKVKDRMEDNSKKFFLDVINGYKELARKNPKRYLVVDGRLNINTIHDLIWKNIKERFDLYV